MPASIQSAWLVQSKPLAVSAGREGGTIAPDPLLRRLIVTQVPAFFLSDMLTIKTDVKSRLKHANLKGLTRVQKIHPQLIAIRLATAPTYAGNRNKAGTYLRNTDRNQMSHSKLVAAQAAQSPQLRRFYGGSIGMGYAAVN